MKKSSALWGYVVAVLVGAVMGGLAVALAARLAPKVMEQMMDKMMAEFPRQMMARMQAEGRDPAEMCHMSKTNHVWAGTRSFVIFLSCGISGSCAIT